MDKQLIRRILAILLSILVTLTIAESSLRVFYYTDTNEEFENINPDPFQIKYNFHKNTTEYLSQSKDHKKDYVVAVIGDSFIYGWRLDENDSIPNLIYEQLKNRIPNLKVLSISKTAANMSDYYLMLDRLKNKRFNQTILYLSNNDQYFTNDNPNPFLVCSGLKGAHGKVLVNLLDKSKLLYFIYNSLTLHPKVMTKLESFFNPCIKQYFFKTKSLVQSMSDTLILSYYWAEQFTGESCKRIKNNRDLYYRTFTDLFGDTQNIYMNDYLFENDCNKLSALFHEDNYHLNKDGNKIMAKKIGEKILKRYTKQFK